MRRAGIAICLALALPSAAHAQYTPSQEDPPPGVTITGAGLARAGHEPLAALRALRDARRRALAIARAAGLRLGGVTKVELQDTFPQFGERSPRAGPLTGSVATVTYAIVNGATGADGAREVSAYGEAWARARPRDPRGNRSIRRALFGARAAVTPRAARAAVSNARRAASAAGLELGPIVSIAQPAEPYFYDPALGTFGPGRYCAKVRRHGSGKRRCSRASSYNLRLEASFEAL
jgi:hypothetical protein